MRRFWLYRDEDEPGISGTGPVADGVFFFRGWQDHRDKVVLSWRTEQTSVAVYDGMEAVEAIHGHGGKTRIVWLDPVRDPRDEHGVAYDNVPRDRCGVEISEGDLVLPVAIMAFERAPYYVSRVEQIDGAWRVTSIGWPECGYGAASERADCLVRVGGGS